MSILRGSLIVEDVMLDGMAYANSAIEGDLKCKAPDGHPLHSPLSAASEGRWAAVSLRREKKALSDGT